MGASDLLVKIGIKDRKDLHNRFIIPAMSLGLIERTKTEAPHSSTQKYRLTAKGQAFLKEQSHE